MMSFDLELECESTRIVIVNKDVKIGEDQRPDLNVCTCCHWLS